MSHRFRCSAVCLSVTMVELANDPQRLAPILHSFGDAFHTWGNEADAYDQSRRK